MKNAPKRIYLQLYSDEMDCITWCEDKINKDDVEYIRIDLISSWGNPRYVEKQYVEKQGD